MGAPRSRTPNEPGAREIAGALYPGLGAVAWIPSDDADVFQLGRPEAFDSFGGWAGELLQAWDGRFVLIDWPALGAAPRGSQAAAALEVLLRFRATDPAPLVERFLVGWVPAGLDRSRLEDLRLWWAHGILWWAGLDLSMGADPHADLTGVYAAARHCLENNDLVSWLSCDAATAAPPRR